MATFDYSETSHDIYKYTLKKDGKSKGYVLFYVFYIDNSFSDLLYDVKGIDANIETSFFYQQTWDDLSEKFIDHFVPSTVYDDNYIKTEYIPPSSDNDNQPSYKIVISGGYVSSYNFYASDNVGGSEVISEQFFPGIYFVLYNTDKKQVVDLQVYNIIASYKFSVSGRPIPYKINSFISDDKCGNLEIKGSFDEIRFGTDIEHYNAFTTVEKILGVSKKYNPDDPYKNVGDNPDDPPDGDFDYNSDDVTIPDLPQTSVTDSGLVTLFAPNNGQLRALAKYLWSDAFSLESFKKLFNNPMDCILGLSILPIHLPHGSAKEITVGNIISTVSCDVCSRQYVKLNCGTFTMSRNAFTGGYLDYSPYPKAYLYLPFIGSQQIDIDEFMNTTIGVEYHIDILTGSMFCYVTRNNKLLLTYSGNCAENVPLSANDFTSTISSMLSIATVGAGAVATIATAGAAAPALAGASEAALGARTASSLIGAGATGAGAVMNSKPSVQQSGSLGGGAGAMGCLYPYILFVAPRISLPGEQNKYTGFPSNKIVKIGSLSGFNVIEAVNLSVKGATDAEVSEIEAVLRNGVII